MKSELNFIVMDRFNKVFGGKAVINKGPGRSDFRVDMAVRPDSEYLLSGLKSLMGERAACSVKMADGLEIFREYDGHICSDSDERNALALAWYENRNN